MLSKKRNEYILNLLSLPQDWLLINDFGFKSHWRNGANTKLWHVPTLSTPVSLSLRRSSLANAVSKPMSFDFFAVRSWHFNRRRALIQLWNISYIFTCKDKSQIWRMSRNGKNSVKTFDQLCFSVNLRSQEFENIEFPIEMFFNMLCIKWADRNRKSGISQAHAVKKTVPKKAQIK